MEGALADLTVVAVGLEVADDAVDIVSQRNRAVVVEQSHILRADRGKVAAQHALRSGFEHLVVKLGEVALNRGQIDIRHAVNRAGLFGGILNLVDGFSEVVRTERLT